MGFKVGQKVVCVRNENVCRYSGEVCPSPRKGDIVTVRETGYEPVYEKHIIALEEYPVTELYDMWYETSNFRPLDYDFVEEVIKNVTPKEVET